MKKVYLFILTGFLFIGGALFAASNFFTDLWTINGTGSEEQTAIAWIDSNYDLSLYNGDLVLGGIATTPSSSNYFGIKLPFYNVGSALAQGDVVIASNTGTGYVMAQPGTIDLTSVVGVADGAIANGTVGFITVSGLAIVKTTGTVAIGDALVTTGTVAGYAGSDTTPTTGAKIGVALEAGDSAGDTILAILTH